MQEIHTLSNARKGRAIDQVIMLMHFAKWLEAFYLISFGQNVETNFPACNVTSICVKYSFHLKAAASVASLRVATIHQR